MQLLVVFLIVQKSNLYFSGHLLAEIQFQSQVIFIDGVNVFDLVYLLETAEYFKELDLTHSLLVDLHLAPE